MAIDNAMYSREDFGWWDGGDDSTNVLLRRFMNPLRFAYFTGILKQEELGDTPGRRILDVGCGGGYLCEEFAGTGFNVTGIDPSRNTLKAARAHAAEGGLSITYEEGRAEAIPFGDYSFDYVSCCDVLEHVDDVNATIREIARVLKPGGLFFYDTVNRTLLSWLMIIKMAQDWKWSAWEAPDTHEWKRFVKPSELGSMMAEHGLAVRGTRGIGASAGPGVLMKAIRQRARGEITRYEMGARFGLEENDRIAVTYMGYAVRQ